MEMAFAEKGGLGAEQERVDPVSGNEIPIGSTAKEVRDDIPAQLSEGEYVVPADVVRYFGVKMFEDLRSAAKQGLQDMESNGRIGGEPVDGPPSDGGEDMSPEEQQFLQELAASSSGDQMQPPPNSEPMPFNEGGFVNGFASGGDAYKDDSTFDNYKDEDLSAPTEIPFGDMYATPGNMTLYNSVSNALAPPSPVVDKPEVEKCPVGTVWNGTACIPQAPKPPKPVTENTGGRGDEADYGVGTNHQGGKGAGSGGGRHWTEAVDFNNIGDFVQTALASANSPYGDSKVGNIVGRTLGRTAMGRTAGLLNKASNVAQARAAVEIGLALGTISPDQAKAQLGMIDETVGDGLLSKVVDKFSSGEGIADKTKRDADKDGDGVTTRGELADHLGVTSGGKGSGNRNDPRNDPPKDPKENDGGTRNPPTATQAIDNKMNRDNYPKAKDTEPTSYSTPELGEGKDGERVADLNKGGLVKKRTKSKKKTKK